MNIPDTQLVQTNYIRTCPSRSINQHTQVSQQQYPSSDHVSFASFNQVKKKPPHPSTTSNYSQMQCLIYKRLTIV